MAEIKEKKDTVKDDLRNFKVESVVNVIPLEPCIVWVAISDKEDETSAFRSIGIPGFYDNQSKKFITLNGGNVDLEGFKENLDKYVENINNPSLQNMYNNQINSENDVSKNFGG